MAEEAIASFLKVLPLSPSNIDTMKELVKMYQEIGDDEKAEKYRKKIDIVAENIERDRLEAIAEKNEKLS